MDIINHKQISKMKKLILILIVSLGTTELAIGADKKDNVNEQVSLSFSRDFAGALNVTWQQEKKYEKATFTLDGLIMSAYYTEEGELKMVSRNILSDHLPLILLLNLKKNYSNYWISDLMEMTSENTTTWYVKLETGENALILKSGPYNEWVIYKKIIKE